MTAPAPASARPGVPAAAAGRPSVALVVEARFPGGTSSAVARELTAIRDLGRLRLVAVRSAMFRGDEAAPALQQACAELGLTLEWDPPTVSADLVVLHNPAFLKFQDRLGPRIVARRLVVVTHENLTRPGGAESFDVARCLGAIAAGSVALERLLAPVSPLNRATVAAWCAANPAAAAPWALLAEDWFNICDFDMVPPVAAPRDRRGRLSRPGPEKFPPLPALEACFPPHAERNLILGGDTLAGLAADHPHWEILPFRALEVDAFFERIDFMVYFTAPTWRESFGRVLAEAVAAGKLAITDAQTAGNLPGAALAARPDEVDGLIAGFIADPAAYGARVRAGQAALGRYSRDAFRRFFETVLAGAADAGVSGAADAGVSGAAGPPATVAAVAAVAAPGAGEGGG